MDIVPKVAVEIARQVVPDEIYEAPLIAENFVIRREKEKRSFKAS